MEYKKRQGETEYEFRLRVCRDWELIGTWPAVTDILNRELGHDFSESTYRKEYDGFRKYFDANKATLVDSSAYLNEIDQKEVELQKETIKFRDQRREFNKLIMRQARTEHLHDMFLESIKDINKICPLVKSSAAEDAANQDKKGNTEAVLFFSDWHYGMVTDNIFNKYNTGICRRRVSDLVREVGLRLNTIHPDILHVVMLGDCAHGAIHASARVCSEEAASDQLMHATELAAEAINELSQIVPKTLVYSTYGNHMRTVQSKNDSVHSDNMEQIVPWWLKERFMGRKDVEIVDGEYYEFIKVNAAGFNIVCTHGDLDKIKDIGLTVNTIFSKKYGEAVDYTVSADKHHVEEFDRMGIESTTVPALCGSDDYANDNRLYAMPGQTMMTFKKGYGKDASYTIRLK